MTHKWDWTLAMWYDPYYTYRILNNDPHCCWVLSSFESQSCLSVANLNHRIVIQCRKLGPTSYHTLILWKTWEVCFCAHLIINSQFPCNRKKKIPNYHCYSGSEIAFYILLEECIPTKDPVTSYDIADFGQNSDYPMNLRLSLEVIEVNHDSAET